MADVLPSIGPFATYTLLLDVAILGTLVWLWLQAPSQQAGSRQWLDAGLAALAGGLIGARLVFVLVNWAYFSGALGEAFAIWRGGLSWPGAVLGGMLGLWLATYVQRQPFWPLFGAFAPAVLWLAAAHWAGCVAAGCAAGEVVEPGSLPIAVYWPDEYGVSQLRWPTQVLALILIGVAFGWWLLQFRGGGLRGWPSGSLTFIMIGIVAAIGLAVGPVRGDDIAPLAGLRSDLVLNSGMLLFAIVAVATLRWLTPAPQPDAP